MLVYDDLPCTDEDASFPEDEIGDAETTPLRLPDGRIVEVDPGAEPDDWIPRFAAEFGATCRANKAWGLLESQGLASNCRGLCVVCSIHH